MRAVMCGCSTPWQALSLSAEVYSAHGGLHLSSKNWRLDQLCELGGEPGDAHSEAVRDQHTDPHDEWHDTTAKAHRS